MGINVVSVVVSGVWLAPTLGGECSRFRKMETLSGTRLLSSLEAYSPGLNPGLSGSFCDNSDMDISWILLKKTKNLMALLKMVWQASCRTIVMGLGTMAMGFESQGERLDSTPNTTWESGNVYPRTGWRSVDGKSLRETSEVREVGSSG